MLFRIREEGGMERRGVMKRAVSVFLDNWIIGPESRYANHNRRIRQVSPPLAPFVHGRKHSRRTFGSAGHLYVSFTGLCPLEHLAPDGLQALNRFRQAHFMGYPCVTDPLLLFIIFPPRTGCCRRQLWADRWFETERRGRAATLGRFMSRQPSCSCGDVRLSIHSQRCQRLCGRS